MSNFIKVTPTQFVNLDHVIEVTSEHSESSTFTFVRLSDGTTLSFEDKHDSGAIWNWWAFWQKQVGHYKAPRY